MKYYDPVYRARSHTSRNTTFASQAHRGQTIILSFVSVVRVVCRIVSLIPTQTDPTLLAGAIYNSPALEGCSSPVDRHRRARTCCSRHLHFRVLTPADPCRFSSSRSRLSKRRRPPLVVSTPLKPSRNRGRRRLAESINLQKKATVEDRSRRLSVTIEDCHGALDEERKPS